MTTYKKPHQHTDEAGYVLIVKCLNADGTGHNVVRRQQIC